MLLAGKIVSLNNPYISPIVRVKENKPVEFGIKVHMMQVDGINIIEHYDYKTYNECKHLWKGALAMRRIITAYEK